MWEQGYLDAKQMGGTFQLLRSGDLIWSRLVHEYLMGQRPPMNDLMAWNADATRLPYRMHSEYLRRLFLDNDLFEGRYQIDGRPVSLGDIRGAAVRRRHRERPCRALALRPQDRSVEGADVTFVLTSGGHNAGIVSEPGHPGRRWTSCRRPAHARYLGPDKFFVARRNHRGVLVAEMAGMARGRSRGRVAGASVGAPERGYAPIAPAPGTYVLQS